MNQALSQSEPRIRRFTLTQALRLSGVVIGFLYVIINLTIEFHYYDVAALVWLVGVVIVAFVDLRRLIRAERRLQRSLAEVEARERQLLDLVGNMDVSVRQELGEWLHGPAQGGLLNLSRQVRERLRHVRQTIADDMAQYPGLAPVRERVIREIEAAARATEVLFDKYNESTLRAKSHQLFPPLLAVNLQLALEELVSNRATLHLDAQLHTVGPVATRSETGAVDSNDATFAQAMAALLAKRVFVAPDLRYAIYRIVEEGMSNAEKKKAERIDVYVDVVASGIRVRIIDRGAPLPERRTVGLGSKVIDTLVAKAGGHWSLINVDQGVQLEAHLPDASIRAVVSDGRALFDSEMQ